MKRLLTVVLVLYYSLLAIAQRHQASEGGGAQGVVSGSVIEARTKAHLPYVSIALYKAKDSSLVTGAITGEDGNFTIEEVPFGKYYLQASFIGFKSLTVPDIKITPQSPAITLPAIILKEDVSGLDEVVIEGERKTVVYQLDKKVVSADKDLAAQGGTASDLLESVPSVQTTADGEISIKGSTQFTVFINGKPSALDASDALNAMPASSIESIEIITNPSAKYDPEGLGGIVNIITKKGRDKGINGLVSASAGSFNQYGSNIIIEYTGDKMKISGGFTADSRIMPRERISNRAYFRGDTTTFSNLRSDMEMYHTGYSANGGIHYSLTDKSTISVEANVGYRSFGRDFDTREDFYTSYSPDHLYSRQVTDFLIENNYYKLLGNYSQTFSSDKHTLTFSFDIFNRETDETDRLELYPGTLQWNDNVPFFEKTEKITDGVRSNKIASIDYVHPISEQQTFETGLYSKQIVSDNSYANSLYMPEQDAMVTDSSDIGAYSIERNIHAGYLLYSHVMDKLSFKAGLRAEYSTRLVEHSQVDKPYEWDLFSLYPSLHVSYTANEKQTFQLSYSKKVRRPQSHFLNPVPTAFESTSIRVGNPLLKPENNHSFELNFQQKINRSSFVAELYYRHSTDEIERVNRLNEDNVFVYTFMNLDSEDFYGSEFVFDLSPRPWWNVYTSFNGFYYTFSGSDLSLNTDNSTFSWNAKMRGTIKLKTKTNFQLSADYNAPTISSSGERGGYFVLNGGINQSLLKNALSIGLSVRDILQTWTREEYQLTHDYELTTINNYASPVFTVSVTYRINNYKKRMQKEMDEYDEE